MNEKIERLAATLYEMYCMAIGMNEFPVWGGFASDINNARHVQAWRSIAQYASDAGKNEAMQAMEKVDAEMKSEKNCSSEKPDEEGTTVPNGEDTEPTPEAAAPQEHM